MQLTFAPALALALLVAGRAAAEEPRETVTLEAARERAFASHPQVLRAAGAVESAAQAERLAFGAYLPSLTASAATGYASRERFNPQTNTTVSGGNAAFNAGVGLGWDVFTGGRRGAEERRAGAQRLSAEARLVADRSQLSLLVEQTFYGALRALELAAVNASRVGRAEEGVAAAERRLSAGTATRSDVLRAELELNTARQAVLQSRTDARIQAWALGRLVGAEEAAWPEATPTADLPDPQPSALERDLAAWLAAAPQVESAEAARSVAEANVSAAKTRYWPAVRFSSGYDAFNQDLSTGGLRTGWSAQLGLSYPLFDGFAREAAVANAQIERRVAEAEAADARRRVRAEAARLQGIVALARERFALARQAVAVAEEDLRVQQDRYRLGFSTMLDLLTSQANLVEAENGLVNARFDHELAQAELSALAGRTR